MLKASQLFIKPLASHELRGVISFGFGELCRSPKKKRCLIMAMTLEGEAFQKGSLRDDVAVLLRERRFEDALAVLYKAKAAAPSDAEIQTAIDQLKDFLVTNCAKQLGGLDKVAPPLPRQAPKTPATMMLAQYIDGRTTFGDIAQVCPLGQLRTLQVLVELYASRSLHSTELSPPASGLRQPSGAILADDEFDPSTTRSQLPGGSSSRVPSVIPSPSNVPGLGTFVAENDDDRRFKELFAAGTTAFIQRRFKDAVEAFQECMKLRPEDKSADVMFKRANRDYQEQIR